MTQPFDLFLFSTDTAKLQPCVEGGLAGAIVDWEHVGKAERQRGVDTQINHDTASDLHRVRGAVHASVICRLNQLGPYTRTEVEAAIAAGADELLLPMVRKPDEVATVLELAAGRCGVGFLVETSAAVARIESFAELPVSRVYVGLVDLWIERRSPNLFSPLLDGTLERVRACVRAPFGFGGLTLPECGSPVACRLLMSEMVRLGCDFSFLRRSFLADTRNRNLTSSLSQIRDAMQAARNLPRAEQVQQRDALEQVIGAWDAQRISA